MLRCNCINPQIISALAQCGHGDKILIADGNYPLASRSGQAEKVYLGLSKDIPTVTDVLVAIKSACGIEAAQVMQPEDGSEPEIFSEFVQVLDGMELGRLGRWEFYDACEERPVRLAISTGESRVFANILITVGAV